MNLASRSRMTPNTAVNFDGPSLEHRFARTVCSASALPRKEWFETLAVLRRIQRKKEHLLGPQMLRIVDVGAGHGLLGMILALVDPLERPVLLLEPATPPSRKKLLAAVARDFPRIGARVSELHEKLRPELIQKGDLVVSSHGCGFLTDKIIDAAIAARARVVVLPCCHPRKNAAAEVLNGFLEPSLALDSARALRLAAAGYQVWTATIDAAVTPKNRLILASTE